MLIRKRNREGHVTPNDFRYGESAAVPPFATVVNRNYTNLLELPVLFYIICLMFHAANRVDNITLILAWAYVALRAVHSLVHLTYNPSCIDSACSPSATWPSPSSGSVSSSNPRKPDPGPV